MDQLVWGQTFGNRRESANVAEQHGKFFALAAGTNVLLWIFFDQLDYARREVLRKTFSDFALGAFFADHAHTGDRGIIGRERACGNHKTEPLPFVREAEIDKPPRIPRGPGATEIVEYNGVTLLNQNPNTRPNRRMKPKSAISSL